MYSKKVSKGRLRVKAAIIIDLECELCDDCDLTISLIPPDIQSEHVVVINDLRYSASIEWRFNSSHMIASSVH